MFKDFGATNITLLHTKDRKVADSEAFVKPLTTAKIVWFVGGRQWRLVDAYLHTRTQREVERVLERGGVVAGSSAGASIISSYMVRGARENNFIMMAPGYEEGFGLIKGVAIDQHMLTRNRQDDLEEVVDEAPGAARHRPRREHRDRRPGPAVRGRRREQGRDPRRPDRERRAGAQRRQEEVLLHGARASATTSPSSNASASRAPSEP